MADESYRWLDLETAERLLRGESLEAVDAAARDQAERLAKTLEALTSEPAPPGTELPGEEGALAAFRKVRADRADDWVSPPASVRHRSGGDPADAGLVRIGAPDPQAARPRRRRPAHFALAAVLAAGVVGGAAAVAATGVLAPSGHGEPEPGSSVSADVTPNRPLVTPTPGATGVAPSPEGSPSGGAGSRDTARGDTGAAPDAGSDGPGARAGRDWKGAAAACRDLSAGKKLNDDRRRSLEGAAGGSPRVWTYCKGVLSEGGGTSGRDGRKGSGRGEGSGRGGNEDDDKPGRGEQGDQNDQGDENGRDDEGGQGGGQFLGPRDNHHGPDGGAGGTTSQTPFVSKGATMSPSAEPSPSYSAL